MLTRMLSRLTRRRRCRNTRLQLDAEDGWLVVRMIDKCTGAAYEATFSPATARRVQTELAEVIGRM